MSTKLGQLVPELGKVVLKLSTIVLVLATPAFANPIAEIRGEGIVITLTDEPCALQEFVQNLPYRTTWTENGKTVEGCAGMQMGVVAAWYADKTVAVFPVTAFTRLQGA